MTETDAAIAARRMVDHQLRHRGIDDQRVLDAMQTVPRHAFIPHHSIEAAYSDRALPTADGQTISQPYIVALMSQMLMVEPGHRVLEIGTGAGYQSAILAELGAKVVSIERVESLAEAARQKLAELGYDDRIEVVVGDGTTGAKDRGPFDRITVTAGAPAVPDALQQQLADPGRIVIPVGDRHGQRLEAHVLEDNHWRVEPSIPCRFVPLLGEQGW